jgi:guanylate kinase
MGYDGIILYGPPASGKDTVTAELEQLDSRYAHFHRLKVGKGRTTGYRFVSDGELADLKARDLVLYESERYGATYSIDRPELDRLISAGRTPVLHMGQVWGIDALLKYPARWLDVLLWCPRDLAKQRLSARGSTDIKRRLTAWDETLQDLESAGREPSFTLAFRTDHLLPETVAAAIDAVCRA